jgi:hypothetical protein
VVPVTDEESEERPQRLRRPRVWLAVGLSLLVLLVLLPLVPVIQPVKVSFGRNWILVGVLRGDAGASGPRGWYAYETPAPREPIHDPDGWSFATTSPLRVRGLRSGSWLYYVTWFQGRRIQ